MRANWIFAAFASTLLASGVPFGHVNARFTGTGKGERGAGWPSTVRRKFLRPAGPAPEASAP